MVLHFMTKSIKMVKGDFMTQFGLTTYLKRVSGIIIITTSILFPLKGSDLKETYLLLGSKFESSGQHFLSYQNYASAFLLEDDRKTAIEIGLKALSPCLSLNRLNEGLWLIDNLVNIDENPAYYETLKTVLYLKSNKSGSASKSLKKIENEERSNNFYFLTSYYFFMKDDYEKSALYLDDIDESFKYSEDINKLSLQLNNPPEFKYKSPLLAGTISMIIPGGGQFYSGLKFDGLNAFMINGLLGSASAVLWINELEKSSENRNFTLPVLSTTIFSIFYITNIYNAYNSANRYNNYNKNRYYNGIFEKFQLVIDDNSLFIGYKETF